VIVAPLTIVLARRALRGSMGAYLLWLGFIAFTVYNYVIYAFAIHFGPLFLLWVAVLGASTFTLVAGAFALDAAAVADAMHRDRRRVAGAFLMTVAGLFTLMWLSDIVSALLAGETPEVIDELNLPTNPVHVLDLAFFLPAAAFVGWSLWQRRPLGYAAAPAVFVLLAATGIPIMTTVVVTAARGQDAAWPLLGVIGVLTIAAIVGAAKSVRWH
ncbi:MAG TPA: hypothetical protein VFX15_05780, partial [Actinomycetes bacterium]|nr:hypothetical protein [Actinomycetes bacterium]